MTNTTEFSIGYFPSTFPRDPIDINIYLEHVLVGQALEPLFTIGDDGQITGSVAKSWKFSNENKTLTVEIKNNLKFSNDSELTADDVIYSIERHLKTPTSQSYNYLKKITKLIKIDKYIIQIELDTPYAPILKALSRDQLGILPKGWNLKKDSNEPFIGTGPYRIIKQDNEWYLTVNPKYRSINLIKIKKFKLKFTNLNPVLDFGDSPVDIMLLSTTPAFNQFKTKFPNFAQTHEQITPFSFVQYSYWWHKDGYSKYNAKEKEIIKQAIEHMNDEYIKKFGGSLSTGVIPNGILGSLNKLEKSREYGKSKKLITLELIVPFITNEFFSNKEFIESIKLKYNIELIITIYNAGQKLDEMNGNLILVSYAGGFFDPEGYLTILPTFLKKSSKEIFGEDAEFQRLNGEKEQDSILRAEFYKNFSKIALKEMRYFPGWVPAIIELRKKGIKKRSTAFKYTYNLPDYFEAN